MKLAKYLFLPVFLFLFVSCGTDEILQKTAILNIEFLSSSSLQQPQEIAVTIEKPTPCHQISSVNKSVNGNIFNYDFILNGPSGDTVCATVIAEETVEVIFDPVSGGEYTLNFLINGKLYETRIVTVTN